MSLTATQEIILAFLRSKKAPATQKDLIEQTGRDRRIVYEATNQLIELGLIKTGLSLRDTRKKWFFLSEQESSVHEP